MRAGRPRPGKDRIAGLRRIVCRGPSARAGRMPALPGKAPHASSARGQPRQVCANEARADMPTRGLVVLAVVTVTTVVASGIAVDKRYRQTVLEARGGEVVFPDLRGRTGGVARDRGGARGGTAFALERRGDGWANAGLGGYPARAELDRDGPLRNRRSALSRTEDRESGAVSEALRRRTPDRAPGRPG